jgi:aconitate hydratase
MTMLTLNAAGAVWRGGRPEIASEPATEDARSRTIAGRILRAHSAGLKRSDGLMHLRFDSLISHDITYVGIVQTARASGMKRFPMPYALTNCHNSLCAVGGTINEDDHAFGLSAAVKYGGIYVPANLAVIHQYAREAMARSGGMILGSDSHTRYGALGTMGVGEGGPELVKQLLMNTYDVKDPEVVLVYLTGAPRPGVGPHDAALQLCEAVYNNGFVKNKVLEFAGPGVKNLPIDFRLGLDVMTTETACLSSVWQTDEAVKDFFLRAGRPGDFKALSPDEGARYDALIEMDLSEVEPMIALPFHPSSALPIAKLLENPGDILREAEIRENLPAGSLTGKVVKGRVLVDQGVIAGCAGGLYDNLAEAAAILAGGSTGCGAFSLSCYPASMPVNLQVVKSGVAETLLEAGAVLKPAFCGPCFGAGDVPFNGGLSIRHTTRNFRNREGSKPNEGQLAMVALMDARSIAATARNGGVLTAADQIEYTAPGAGNVPMDLDVYQKRVYFGWGAAKPKEPLKFGPNIADWPTFGPLKKHLLLAVASVLTDPVTTTDELIPSGETSSYRSNPVRLSEFTLSRRDPGYVARSKAVRDAAFDSWNNLVPHPEDTDYASAIWAMRPGDGSAREQAASCQRVLGGRANLCLEYATKRYRSNLINWGILPFTTDEVPGEVGDLLLIEDIQDAIRSGADQVTATRLSDGREYALKMGSLDADQRRILLDGCLMNYYASTAKERES